MVDPLLSSEELFSGHGWKITLDEAKLPDGKTKKAARAHRSDSVHILAFPAVETVLLLHEYRPHYGQYLWMLPSGKMDKGSERPEEAAMRELREETGFKADELTPYCSGRNTEMVVSENHVFIARKLVSDPLPKEQYEFMELHELPISEAIEKVLASPIVHTISAYALLRYAREHGL